MDSRHGLRTVLLGTPGEDRRRTTAHVLAGTTTRRLRLLPDHADRLTEPLEAVGDLQMLLDDTGRSVAVLQVDAVQVTDWASLRTSAVLPGPWSGPEATRPDDPVAIITFHILGRSEP